MLDHFNLVNIAFRTHAGRDSTDVNLERSPGPPGANLGTEVCVFLIKRVGPIWDPINRVFTLLVCICFPLIILQYKCLLHRLKIKPLFISF